MLTVLVVDDDALIREIAKDILDIASYRVLTAKDVPECLNILRKEKIDAFLLDVVLPGESGLKMVPKINDISPDSAIIIMTAHASTEAAIEAIKVGADDFIRKPLQEDELSHAIKKAIDKKALLLENRTLTQRLEGRLKKLELFKNISKEISSTLDLPKLLEEIMQSTKAAIGAEACSVLMYDEATGNLVFEVALGKKGEDVEKIRIKPGQGIAGWVFEHKESLLVGDVQKDTRFFQAVDKNTGFETRSMVVSPLIVKDKTLGVIQVINKVHGGRFEIDDRDTLTTLSGQIAVAIENAKMTENIRNSKEALQRAHDELEKRVLERTAELSASNKALRLEVNERKAAEEKTKLHLEQIAALRFVDKAIAGSLDLGITLGIIVEQIISQLQVDAATILLYKPQLETLEYAAGRGFNTQALQYTKLKIGDSHAGRAALERRIVHTTDLRGDGEGFKRSKHLAEEGFISYYGAPLVAKGEIKGVLEVFNRNVREQDQEWMNFLEAFAGQAAIAIDNATLFDELQRSNINLTLSYDETIEGWSRALDLRDKETEGHSQRVTELTMKIVRILGVNEAEQAHIRRGALLHDIGKMGIPDRILLKPGALDDEEWEIMRKHTTFAYELLSPIDYLRPALDIPYCHHEKWNGTGYPRGLKGERIPLAARIFAVVDIYDAMCSERPYHPPLPEEAVLEHISSLAGSHLDPKMVEVFLNLDKETSI
jgi:putative nucleotidyltransferase with HDIG domain